MLTLIFFKKKTAPIPVLLWSQMCANPDSQAWFLGRKFTPYGVMTLQYGQILQLLTVAKMLTSAPHLSHHSCIVYWPHLPTFGSDDTTVTYPEEFLIWRHIPLYPHEIPKKISVPCLVHHHGHSQKNTWAVFKIPLSFLHWLLDMDPSIGLLESPIYEG